jgi:hypothetical protein
MPYTNRSLGARRPFNRSAALSAAQDGDQGDQDAPLCRAVQRFHYGASHGRRHHGYAGSAANV